MTTLKAARGQTHTRRDNHVFDALDSYIAQRAVQAEEREAMRSTPTLRQACTLRTFSWEQK